MGNLTLYDFSDAEFLAVLRDNGDAEGWVSTDQLAEALGFGDNLGTGSRLGWLRRFGVVERDLRVGSPTRKHWRLTTAGEAVVRATFSQTQNKMLDSLRDEQLFVVARKMSDRYPNANNAVANLTRRQIMIGFHRRGR